MPNGICETNINNGCSKETKLKRNNYFSGKKMDVDDFNAEQNYVIDKIRTLSTQTNGSGVINGLRIDSISGSTITLNPGAAIDACGNLLMVYKQRVFEIERAINADDYIYLKYTESGSDKVPRQNSVDCSDECCYDRIEEDVQIVVSSELLTPVSAQICDGTAKNSGVMSKEPLVLLGVYRHNGGIDYSGVVYLHKNSELSKKLCEISKKYVSSVNGLTGDVSAVSSINNAVPNGSGHINVEGGNNIAIESSGNTVKISAQSGFYAAHEIKLAKAEETTLTHNCRRYPVVDVYRKVVSKEDRFEAVHIDDIKRTSKDMFRDFDDVKTEMELKTFDEYMEIYNQNSTSGIKVVSERSTMPVYEVLSMIKVNDSSASVNKMSDRPISKVKEKLLFRQKFAYQKILGAEDANMKITVTHTSLNGVGIKNNGNISVSLLVILST